MADKVINIKNGTMVIGRNASCDIILANDMISSQHAQIQFVDGIIKLKDLDSTNGTYVNGKRISESLLFDGYDVSFDMVSFKLKAMPPPASKTRVRSAVGFDRTGLPPAIAPHTFNIEPTSAKAPHHLCPGATAFLEVIQGQSNKSRYNLNGGALIFGRLGTSDVALQDEAVSNFHALVSRIDGHWVLEDYGSANGTYINNHRITRQALKHCDIIRLGHTVMRFNDPEKSIAGGSENHVQKGIHVQGRLSKRKILLPIFIFSLVILIGIIIFLAGVTQW
jgi:pSer/pThr/pTyr-binding forkhead associated (FHA) protein